jgi:beta-glucosidase
MKPPLFSLAFLLATPFWTMAQQHRYPFQNQNLQAEERIDNILSLMTLDEKVNCLGTNPSVPRLGIKGSPHIEGLHGVAKGGPSNWGRLDPVTTTIFPQAIGLAESWDVQTIERVGAIEGYEARYLFQSPKYKKGGIVVRAPNADLGRDPRWGRTEECYGEDGWLNGALVAAFVKGLQGKDPKYWQAASLMKHFLANSNEEGRFHTSSGFDEQLFHEYYSLPFRMGVEAGSRAFMTAYNSYDSIPCIVHPVLKNVTVKEWGQDGIICTDGGALGLLVTDHKFFPDLYTGAAGCLRAGITQFLDRSFKEAVYGALANHYITEATIDSALRGNYRVMIKLGLLDPPEMVPYSSIGISDTLDPWLSRSHRDAAREVTRETIVLLKNSPCLLPLDRNNVKSIAVIGKLADTVLLDWYSGTPPYIVTPLAGIQVAAGQNVKISYAKDNRNGAAVRIAQTSDVAIVCVGNNPTCDGDPWGECSTASDGREAVDRKTIILEQEELIQTVYGANPNTIVVLISNFPFAIDWTQRNVPAIVHLAHASQEQGNALADVLFGAYNPGGKLVETWPKSTDTLPPMMDYNIRNGRTYMYSKTQELYTFGYGLSYVTFEYSNLRLSSPSVPSNGTITVSVDIHNSGKVVGDEVVQLYVRHVNSVVERPIQQLRGFKRITLAPNETKTVAIPLTAASLAYWSEKRHNFVVEKDRVTVMVGSSSKDIRLHKTIAVVE